MSLFKNQIIFPLSTFKIPFLMLIIFVGCSAPRNITRSKMETNLIKWQRAESPLLTRWGKTIDPNNTWNIYPRPQHQRVSWKSLNGLWKYEIKNDSEIVVDNLFEQNILVPFPIESALSGVGKKVTHEETLWYQTFFNIPDNWDNQKILLHFGAVDWETNVWINNQKIGQHKGGYDPFFFDITPYLKDGENELKVSVKDPTDQGYQPVGKQVLNPKGIFYTAVTGIWQTVWIEPVETTYLESFKCITDIDKNEIIISPIINNPHHNTNIKIEVFWKDTCVNSILSEIEENIHLSVPHPKLWSPDEPNLYDLSITIYNGKDEMDNVTSYFGMRKIHIAKADDGFVRIFLNNNPLFQNGPLDQGYWPDGLYTPPSDQAIKEEIELIKKLGFNMLRKHVKVEPDRFYYWCDKIGILVWQDMPNGDEKIGPSDPDIIRSSESETQFEYELQQLINTHYNHPSIVMWIPFNEGWGQYKTGEVVTFVKELDSTRLVNNASGWADRGIGDVNDLHHYPNPLSPKSESNRAIVLGEFGGIGLPIKDHLWNKGGNWGYSIIDSKDKLTNQYESYYSTIWEFAKNGLSACVYTQLTDVETETNGLLTYDRAVLKMNDKDLMKINKGKYIPAPTFIPDKGLLNTGDIISIKSNYPGIIRYSTDGSNPNVNSNIYNEPIVFESDLNLAAALFSEYDSSRITRTTFKKTYLIKPVYRNMYSSKYDGGGIYALMDGKRGSMNFNDGKWQGFEAADLDIIVDLGKQKRVSSIKVNFLQSIKSWIFYPEMVKFLTSKDGVNYREQMSFSNKIPKDYESDSTKLFSAALNNLEIRYIKIVASNINKVPNGTPAQVVKHGFLLMKLLLSK